MPKCAGKVSKYFKSFVSVVFRTEFISKLDMALPGERKNKAGSIISSITQGKWALSLYPCTLP